VVSTSRSRGEARKREILAAAVGVLAARDGAGMAEVADAAGIARGTLYRYFPTRESLLQALEAAANEEARQRLAEANLDQVPVEEALARATRALVAVGEHFIVLLRERRPPEPGFTAPLVALIKRGRKHGQIRSDIPLTCLVESLLVLIGACVRTGRAAGMGSEDISSTALRLFLTGAGTATDESLPATAPREVGSPPPPVEADG
jgi:TetR/AcrR family transcriptional repressor of mexCD-oprJ operon